MTCKDCIHYDDCKDLFVHLGEKEEAPYMDDYGVYGAENECRHFKDKSRFVELPCKVGDTLYFVLINGHIVEDSVVGFYIDYKIVYAVTQLNYVNTDCRKIGETIFLTREEAEAKLKELEK